MKYSRAFTLIEILISIVIISFLIIILTVSYGSARAKSKCTRIRQDFDSIAKAARLHYETTGAWAPMNAVYPYVPAFVPEYLTQWPDGTFWSNSARYYWANGLSFPVIPTNNQYINLTYQVPVGTSVTNKYYIFCLNDQRPGANPSNCVSGTAYSNFPILNFGGTCP